ncbi:MAG: hypothetical protein ACOCX9_03160 [Spirochaetota bacterium]
MKQVKKHSIIAIALLSVIIGLLIFLRIYFSYMYPEKMLKDSVRGFFKENFNKAITLDEVDISTTGNLVVKNLNVSIGSDFNDNISLISCSEAIIDMKFIPMLRGEPVVNGMNFRKAMVTIVKNYGKPYAETFNSIFLSINDVNNMKSIDMSNFSLSLNGVIVYREILRDDRFEMKIRNVIMRTNITNSQITYDLSGTLLPYGSVELGDGSISINGKIYLDEDYVYRDSRHSIRINNFDISYGNIFIKEHDIAKINAGGGVTLDGELVHGDNSITGQVKSELNNLGLYYHADPKRPFAIVSNENCNATVEFAVDQAGNKISIQKYSIYDDRISINGSCGYENSDQNHYVELEMKSNTINLEDVSKYLVPYQNLSYNGKLNLDCNIGYNIREHQADKFNIDVLLDKSSASVFQDGSNIPIFKDGTLKIKGHPESLVMKMSAVRNRSDLTCDVYSDVSTWYPFSANSVMTLKSSVMELDNISKVIVAGISKLYEQSLIDAKKGYDETYFMQTSAGEFMVNNDIAVNMVFQKVLAGKAAQIDNCILSLKSEKGRVKLDRFEMTGYNAQYDFDCEGYFNRDYPLFSMSGSINSFNLDDFCQDSEISTSTGILSLAFDFEVNAYRLYHLLNNGRGSFTCSIRDGKIEGTGIQKQLQNFFSEPGYELSTLDRINYSSGDISVRHYGRNWYVRNIELNGDSLQLSGRGNYILEEGLNIPVYAIVAMQVKDKEKAVNEKVEKRRIPLVIKSSPLKPILKYKKEQKKKSLILFNVN